MSNSGVMSVQLIINGVASPEQGMASPPHGFNHVVVTLAAGAVKDKLEDLALDIGGTLVKLVFSRFVRRNGSAGILELHMVTFNTADMEAALRYIKDSIIGLGDDGHNRTTLKGTGTGCLKFGCQIETLLGVRLVSDSLEVQHAARGLDFLWRHLPASRLLYDEPFPALNYTCPLRQSGILPCLLVNIGSACTMIRIDEDGPSAQVAGGSCLGGMSFMGLGALLTHTASFKDLLDKAERGDHRRVDLLLSDSAGGKYAHLPSDTIVSYFGKAAMATSEKDGTGFQPEDIAASLLHTISFELAQTTYLLAKMENVHYVCFCGSFLGGNRLVQHHLQQKLHQCSNFLQHQVTPVFVQHESYLGALGVLVSEG